MAKRTDPMKVALILCALLIWAAAVYFALKGPRSLFGSAPTADTTQPAASSSSSTSGGPAASQTAGTAGSAAGSATGAPASTAPTETSACVAALFPEHTFKAKPDLAFVCTEANALTGATEVKSQVVLGSTGGVSQGMRLWAGLGWYNMAAYSLLRTQCCAEVPKLTWKFDLMCPVDERLAEIETAMGAKDIDELEASIERYTKDVRCLSKFGQANNFGQSSGAGAGVLALRKLLEKAGLSKK
jgi:hypothetical protein